MIELHGACSLYGKGLKHNHLEIISDTSGEVDLKGYVGIHALTQTKNNLINIVWVDTESLDIHSTAGRLRLAGVARHARVNAFGTSQADLTQLRSTNLWLQQKNGSRVITRGKQDSIAYLSHDSQLSQVHKSILSNRRVSDNSLVDVNTLQHRS